MTINVPLIGNCPRWEEDIPPARIDEFKASVARVQQEILSSAASTIVTPDEARRWHSLLFDAFVPLRYYAGNFRGVDQAMPCLAMNNGVGSSIATVIPGAHFYHARRQVEALFETTRQHLGSFELRWGQLTPAERAFQLAVITANLVGPFIRIHPFVNGNGRISRLLWRWCLLRFGLPVQCCVHPRPGSPYANLMDSAMHGDYKPLVLYVLQHLDINRAARN